jgi:hypothetical protein
MQNGPICVECKNENDPVAPENGVWVPDKNGISVPVHNACAAQWAIRNGEDEACKASVTLPGTVEKIIPPIAPALPEKAQIRVDGAEDLYQEIRIENKLQDEAGNTVTLIEYRII